MSKKLKKRTSHENYVLLQLMTTSKRHTQFSAKTFIRCIQPFCKTSNLKNQLLFIRLRGSKVGVCIEVQNNNYFVVKYANEPHEFHLFCESAKELLFKLMKHNLLTP